MFYLMQTFNLKFVLSVHKIIIPSFIAYSNFLLWLLSDTQIILQIIKRKHAHERPTYKTCISIKKHYVLLFEYTVLKKACLGNVLAAFLQLHQ